jgi:DNA-binding response OmpR family regulator
MRLIDYVIGWFKPPRIEHISVSLPYNEVKKQVKIVVVDDDEASFPTKGLQADGYTVEWWERVDASRLRRLEEGDFTIIILDIQGIVEPALSDTGDALGIVRRVKTVNPAQVIVAFSGQSYDLGSVPFFRQTDDTLLKPVTLIQCKEMIDRLIQRHVSVVSYWANLSKLLETHGVSSRRIRRLEKEVIAKAKEGRSISIEDVRRTIGTISSLHTAWVWANKIVDLCKTVF